MSKTTALLFIGLLALLVAVSACTKNAQTNNPVPTNNAQTVEPTADNTDAAIIATDPTSDIINDTPADPGTLDDFNVSDEIPQ